MKRIVTVAFGLLALSACSKTPEAAAIEANADALADNMEAMADNMDAMADAAVAATVNDQKLAEKTASDTSWVYDEKKDEMRGAVRKTASVTSSNTLHLSPPYDDTNPTLTIRKDPKFGFNIYISSDGQPLCRSYNDDTLSVKFDSGPIKEWSCSESSDGSPGIVFFNRESAMLSQIKNAKKMIVEINYYDAGRQQITFPVAGLKW